MRTISSLLSDAREMLDRAGDVDAWSRSAAFLARQALEAGVLEAIERAYGRIDRPTFTSQLVVLRSVVDEDVAREIAWTWSALSAATHAHSYELPATGAELRRWIDSVGRLTDKLDDSV